MSESVQKALTQLVDHEPETPEREHPRLNAEGRYRENLEVALTTLVVIARREGGPSETLMRALQVAEHVLTHGHPPQVETGSVSSQRSEPLNSERSAENVLSLPSPRVEEE